MNLLCGFLILLCVVLGGCRKQEKHHLDALRENFIKTLFTSGVEEGPFNFNYHLKTVFFSDEIVSLFGSFNEYTQLPHGHGFYEGQTFYKIEGRWLCVSLDELFISKEQQEFLRSYCERDLKIHSSYLENTGCDTLPLSKVNTFVINHDSLIIIFQPYVAGSYTDGPFVVEIPFEYLENIWNSSHPFVCILKETLHSKSFIVSWDEGIQ